MHSYRHSFETTSEFLRPLDELADPYGADFDPAREELQREFAELRLSFENI